jgi:hypothetical protein
VLAGKSLRATSIVGEMERSATGSRSFRMSYVKG